MLFAVSLNRLSHEPVRSAQRFTRRSNKKVEIPQPHLIKKYNEGMGGVDVMDRLLGAIDQNYEARNGVGTFSALVSTSLSSQDALLLHCKLHKATDAITTHIAL
ncbi:hypothetical protein HPB51_029349 [Rhipicephalus microplus]|uniref:Uncharacterized protein n=1 Tax=Rhipicephalus microplus TaxID=6941 RepID=A0A9J6CUG1_RHIMP|nr:hypothetical protein HPB51_029349 [Rhipicephalus microplus]